MEMNLKKACGKERRSKAFGPQNEPQCSLSSSDNDLSDFSNSEDGRASRSRFSFILSARRDSPVFFSARAVSSRAGGSGLQAARSHP